MQRAKGIPLSGIAQSRTAERQERAINALWQRQPDLTLVLANIHDPHNVSAIYRSCDAFGVSRVHLLYNSAPFPALGAKSSASARKWVESSRHSSEENLLASLRQDNFQILATSFTSRARPLREWNFLRPVAIILGNEHSGVEQSLQEKADGELFIPMHGMIQSFNVSVAAAIILAEAARQREEAGYYDRPETGMRNLRENLNNWLEI